MDALRNESEVNKKNVEAKKREQNAPKTRSVLLLLLLLLLVLFLVLLAQSQASVVLLLVEQVKQQQVARCATVQRGAGRVRVREGEQELNPHGKTKTKSSE